MQAQHAIDMAGDRIQRFLLISLRIALAQLQRLLQAHAIGYISVQRIVRRSLVGQDIRYHTAFGQSRNDVRAISHQPDRNIFLFADGVFQNAQRFVERRHHEVAVPGFQPLLNALGIDIYSQKCRARHGCGEWLGSTHSAHATADDQLAREISPKVLLSCRRESLESSLHDPL